jgi:hypothetical protein
VAFSVHSTGVDQVLICKEWYDTAVVNTPGYLSDSTLGSTFSRFPRSVRPSFYVMGNWSNRPTSMEGVSANSW